MYCTSALQSLCLVPLLDALIQRLQHPGIDRGDHIDRSLQFFFRHPRFPCVRKAPVNSWITEAHHRDGETDQHLLALGETFDGVRVTVESSEIGFLQERRSYETGGRSMLRPYSIFYAGFTPVISAKEKLPFTWA